MSTTEDQPHIAADDATWDQLRKKRQLTFDLGAHNEPDVGTVKFSGSLLIDRDLQHGQEVIVTVSNALGDVLATGRGVCGWPSFKDHVDKFDDVTTERIHTVTL